jgi:hypothetical protein
MTTATKQLIESKWNTQKIQEETARLLASQWMAAYGVICEHGEEAIKKFENVKLQGSQSNHPDGTRQSNG